MTPERSAPSTEIYLGDLARALARLQPADAATRAGIARCLDYILADDQAPAAPPPRPATRPASARPEPRAAPSRPPSDDQVEDEPAPRSGAKWLRPRRPPMAAGADMDAILQGPALPTQTSAETRWQQPLPGLLDPNTVRSILFFALATAVCDAEIDVEALVRFLSFQEEWRGSLPRLARSTVRCGVQVVIDRRLAMRPFYGDQNFIAGFVRRVVGDRSEFVTFQNTPNVVIRGASLEARDYRPPAAGTPVLLLSDLGIGRPIQDDSLLTELWLGFARRVREAECPLIAFVPYPASRWPTALRREFVIVHWDRPTTPGKVRKLIGLGHGMTR